MSHSLSFFGHRERIKQLFLNRQIESLCEFGESSPSQGVGTNWVSSLEGMKTFSIQVIIPWNSIFKRSSSKFRHLLYLATITYDACSISWSCLRRLEFRHASLFIENFDRSIFYRNFVFRQPKRLPCQSRHLHPLTHKVKGSNILSCCLLYFSSFPPKIP